VLIESPTTRGRRVRLKKRYKKWKSDKGRSKKADRKKNRGGDRRRAFLTPCLHFVPFFWSP
jgi:hypothetical protein